MGLNEDAPLLRMFSDALEVADGVTLLGGMPYSGVGASVDSTGRCKLVRYVDGSVSGPYVEPLVDGDQSLVVFQDESETFLEEHPGEFRFEDEPFTGFGISPHPAESQHVGSMVRYANGRYLTDVVEWYPGGRLSTFDRAHQSDGRVQANSLFRWHPDGTMAMSKFSVEVDGDGQWRSTEVQFDEAGRIVRIAIDPFDEIFKRIGEERTRELAQGRVFVNFDELVGLQVGRQLWLGPVSTSEVGLGHLLAYGAMDNLEEIDCYLTAARLRELLELPNLRRVRFGYKPPDPESMELLTAWQAATLGRELEI